MSTITKTNNSTKTKSLLGIRSVTVIGLLSAIAIVLMLFEIPLGFAPSFYKIDLSEVPVLIGAFALGPVAGIVIEAVKIALNLLIDGTITAGVGEAANFAIGCALVVPSAIIYQRKKTRKSALMGLIVGTIVLVVIGSVLNAYVLLPTYAKAFHMDLNALVAMGTAVNPAITSLNTFVLFAVAPFNLIKGVAVSILTLLLYKKISPILKGEFNG